MIILTRRIISDKLGLKGFEVKDWRYNIEQEVITNLLGSKGKIKQNASIIAWHSVEKGENRW